MKYKVGDTVIAVKQYDDGCPYAVGDKLIVEHLNSSNWMGIRHMRIRTSTRAEWNIPYDCVKPLRGDIKVYIPSKRAINVTK